MNELLAVAAYITFCALAVIVLAKFAEWSVTFWDTRYPTQPPPGTFDRHAEDMIRMMREDTP